MPDYVYALITFAFWAKWAVNCRDLAGLVGTPECRADYLQQARRCGEDARNWLNKWRTWSPDIGEVVP